MTLPTDNQMFNDVDAFHAKFGLQHFDGKGQRYGMAKVIEFRRAFMQEELDEFDKGVAEHDHAQMADALVDLAYVILGTAHMLNYPFPELWDDVQRANMTKKRANPDGSNSKRGNALDVVKPAGWHGPHTAEILKQNGFNL